MHTLITYLSRSGNTRRVAEAIREGLEGSGDMRPMDEVESLDGYDLVFVGFPIVGAGAPGKVRRFLTEKASGKKVVLFVTHGMSPDVRMLKGQLENCREAARGAEVLGIYDCQGKLNGFVALMLRLHPRGEVRAWVKAGGESIGVGHPSASDLQRARAFAAAVAA